MIITIQEACAEDIQKCLPLAQTKELEGAKGKFPTLEELQAGYESKSAIFLVAKNEKNIVGFALGYIHSRQSCYLDLLVVDKEIRGQGIGTKLLQAFEKEAQNKKIDHLWLISHLYNSKDHDFYTKKHFSPGDKFQIFAREI